MDSPVSIQFLFDPLCGWCYAASPALLGLSLAFPNQVELLPSGMFAGDGARDLSPSWAGHAWSNDQRIMQMTGQPFSEAYRTKILQGTGVRFDSGPLTVALTLMCEVAPQLEVRLLQAFQRARYVDGADTGNAAVVGRLADEFAKAEGLSLASDYFSSRVSASDLTPAAAARIEAGQDKMEELGARGVPLLAVRVGGKTKTVNGGALYEGADAIIAAVNKLVVEAGGRPAVVAAVEKPAVGMCTADGECL